MFAWWTSETKSAHYGSLAKLAQASDCDFEAQAGWAYTSKTQTYEPDFVVETKKQLFLCEPKRADQMQNPTLLFVTQYWD